MSDGNFTLEDLLKAKAIVQAATADWTALAKKWGVDPERELIILPIKYEVDSGFSSVPLPDWIKFSEYVEKPLVVMNLLKDILNRAPTMR